MDHTDCFIVTNFSRCKRNNALIMPNNHVSASIVCNHILRTTHVQKTCVDIVATDIHCYIWPDNPNKQMTEGLQPINLQVLNPTQLQKLIRIAHSRANLEITSCLLQPVLKFKTRLVSTFLAEHCWTVLLSHTSLQRDVYNV